MMKLTKENADRKAENLPISEASAREVAALAARRGVPVETLWYELFAEVCRDLGYSVPKEIEQYLRANNRPVPPAVKRDSSKHSLH
jgi:hypothetical protein